MEVYDDVDTQELTECSNELCQCTLMGPLEGEAYCSDSCRTQDEGGIEIDACQCGHPGCKGEQLTA